MTRLIKKYKNRRLYDTDTSQYITIEQLQQYVIDGVIFRVEDSQTNQDLTSATLLQIFVEMESGASQFLTAEMLRQLIIVAHHPMSQSFKSMLAQVFIAMEKPSEVNSFVPETMQAMLKPWQDLFKL